MEQDVQSGLFEVTLDEAGKKHISRSSKLIGAIAVLMVIEALLTLVIDIKRINDKSTLEYKNYWVGLFDQLMPWLGIIMLVLNLLAVYFYLRFARRLDRSIRINNALEFNDAFRDFYTNLSIWLASMIISFIVSSLFLYVEF